MWLVLLFSLPLWLAASFLDATKIIPVKLPLSALQFLSVLGAAIVVTHQGGGSVRELLRRGIDMKRIKNPMWCVGIFVLMPLTVGLSYLMIVWRGAPVSDKMTPLLSIPIFLLVYGISGYCEQMGWTAMMTDPLLKHRTVIMTGFIVGTTWAAWHIIPFIQMHNTALWIIWQCLYTIIYRVLLTKVYVLTNCSVFSTIAMHATYNTAFSLMPYYGSSYNPMYMAISTVCTTIVVFILLNSPRSDELITH
ncbi:CPBP family glutamic-type intramembrane protease [Leptolyngbya sp. AN03gr2]|uniref:CPBP family glutamic-type intramembrane protease n=1 Tax=unclassified Leptolyngbya TaxID=2650499 RepID=UPI003D31748B